MKLTATAFIAACAFPATLFATHAYSAPAPGEDSQEAWWIIAGSAAPGADREIMNAVRSVERCGLHPQLGRSDEFMGLRPNLVVVYLGPFVAKNGMENFLEVVRRCAPDAYPKWTVNWVRNE